MTEFQRPLVLGINQEAPTAQQPLAERLASYGQNTGNLLFAEALFQVVAGARRGPYHFEDHEAAKADAIIIAAANWINEYSDFGALAERLKATGKPVILIGIGIQKADVEVSKIKRGTRALLDVAATTSALISTRGWQTEAVLKKWGYADVMATGCPSLLMSDGRFTTHAGRPAPTPENTVLMGTRHLINKTPPQQAEIYLLAYRQGFDILMQSELADMYFIESENRDFWTAHKANPVLTATYQEEDIQSVRRYLARHGKVFFHARDWRAYLQSKEYVLGTRIHGTIAAILSGRRGLLLHHDARTAELAEIMGVPTAPIADLRPVGMDRVEALIEAADFEQTARNFPRYFARFQQFFAANGIGMRRPAMGFGGTAASSAA